MVLIGDDLNFAQKFTRTAADGLSLLAEMEDPRAKPESATITDMMVTLQRGAKRLRARHIYSGAQNVLTALHHEGDETLNGRIRNLGSVVTEYARGLEELLQAPEISAVETQKDKWDTARETLNEMLPQASPETADMLSRLMRAPVTPVTPHSDVDLPDFAGENIDVSDFAIPALNADIIPFERAEAPAASDRFDLEPEIAIKTEIPASEIQNPVLAGSEPSKAATGRMVTLDAMMRDVVADALSVARIVERTISVSYDMGERTITESGADNLRSRLGQALSQIIRQSFTDNRIGHIDVNLAGEQLHIVTGTTAVRVAIDPEDAPAAKPLITPENEKDIRAQLDALMDPISLHETAS